MDILSKKMLLDMPNAAVAFGGAYGTIALQTTPAFLSLCLTLKMTQANFDSLPIYTRFIGQQGGNATYSYLYNQIYKNGAGNLVYLHRTGTSGERSLIIPQETVFNGNPHRIVAIVNSSGAFVYVDTTRVANWISSQVPTEFTTTNSPFSCGTAGANLTGATISNIKYFNFDISATGAPYTLDDYQNNRDIPDGISGVILNLHNNLSGTTWTDESGNGYNMALSGDFEITDE